MAIRLYGGYAPAKVEVQKKEQVDCVMLDIETVRIVEEMTGEKMIDDGIEVIAPDKDDDSPL